MKEYRITDYGVKENCCDIQTEAFQKVFDLCKEDGGKVIIPKGTFKTAGIRMWSNTTLYLESGACLLGSDICEEYPVFDVPAGVELRTDMELISQYYKTPWKEYRRALISVYGGENIAIIGEKDSTINGGNCCDPKGEEGYRGPHGIFLTNVKGITLNGYRIGDCGNFIHQIDNCSDISVHNVTCDGGSDGFHLHFCRHTLIEKCVFHTGDDCVAGINIEDLTIRDCEFNASCQVFRIGGSHVLVENCHAWGPGIYPHRMSIVQGRYTDAVRDRKNDLPMEMGRHNTVCFWLHFASMDFPAKEAYHDIKIRNCFIENVDTFMHYMADNGTLETGTYLKEICFENVVATGLKNSCEIIASEKEPLTVTMKNTRTEFCEEGKDKSLFLTNLPFTTIIREE